MTSRKEALAHFKKVDPHFFKATKAHHASLPEKLSERRTRADLFTALARTVVGQQLAGAAAQTIFNRLKEACNGSVTPEKLLKLSPAKFRSAGLSGAKMKTLQEISKAVKSGTLDLLALKKIPESEATARLTAIWGLGPWSAEMFLMFSVGRPDIFSSGDLGLARGIELIFNLKKNTPRATLIQIAAKWSPYRTYASFLLWRTKDAK